jgi:3-hydroxybutyryl-CoA dehydrogenase
MGMGIAEVFACAGADVVAHDLDARAITGGRERLRASMARAVGSGRLPPEEAEGAGERIRFTTSLDDLADCDLVIESIVEDEGAKTALLASLDARLRPDAVLATNTSSIPVTRLAAAVERPERVVGLHFSNPVPAMPIIEVVATLQTSTATLAVVDAVAARLGKRIVRSADRAGFVINGLLIPYLLSAVRMLDAGVATADDIDAAMVGACRHPMGPLAVLDLIGLDTALHVAEVLHAEHGDVHLVPPPLLRRLVESGSLGRKTGRGFHRYDSDDGSR